MHTLGDMVCVYLGMGGNLTLQLGLCVAFWGRLLLSQCLSILRSLNEYKKTVGMMTFRRTKIEFLIKKYVQQLLL